MRSIFDEISNLSVRHNSIFIPGRSVQHVFSRYAVCLGIWNDFQPYPISLPGSASLIRYQDRYLMICTRHQLKNSSGMENVCIMLPGDDNTTRCITSGGARWFEGIYSEESHEIAIFDFSEPVKEIPELKSMFLDFRGQHPSVPSDAVVGFCAYGYPSQLTAYEEDGSAASVTCQAIQLSLAAQESDPSVHSLNVRKPLSYSPDGLSGGPVFCILVGSTGFEIHFTGVIATASRTRVRAIKSGAIQAVIDTTLQIA